MLDEPPGSRLFVVCGKAVEVGTVPMRRMRVPARAQRPL
jgi:hypothetical protein